MNDVDGLVAAYGGPNGLPEDPTQFRPYLASGLAQSDRAKISCEWHGVTSTTSGRELRESRMTTMISEVRRWPPARPACCTWSATACGMAQGQVGNITAAPKIVYTPTTIAAAEARSGEFAEAGRPK